MCNLERAEARRGPVRQRGVTLVGMMLGLLIAMLVVLAATGASLVLAARQRQGVGTVSADVMATTALAGVKQDVAHAGLGFFMQGAYACDALNVSIGSRDLSQPSFVPLRATRGPVSDVLEVVHAESLSGGASVPLETESDGRRADLHSFLPASVGRTVLLLPEPGSAPGPCTVRTVDEVVASEPPLAMALRFDRGGAHNQVAFGSDPRHAARSRVAMLGRVNWHRYRVTDGALMLERPLEGDAAVVLRDVVAFRVQYGLGAQGAASVASWVEPEGAWAVLDAASVARVRAVRLGVVTRSPYREKPPVNGACQASASLPVLFGANVATVASDADWACFRYRTVEVTVPMRNVVLGVQ